MLLTDLFESSDQDVKLIVVSPGYMGVLAIMPRVIDEFGFNVVSAIKKDGNMAEETLAVLPKDADKIINLINDGTFNDKIKVSAKLAPSAYYTSNIDLEKTLEFLKDSE